MPRNYIPVSECVDRHAYKIKGRNLDFGVFRTQVNGFIGIREKFGLSNLSEEYHHDTGGTVYPLEDIDVLPDDIEAKENVDAGCSECGGRTEYHQEIFDLNKKLDRKVDDPDHKWPWVCENGCGEPASGTLATYWPLFDYLKEIGSRPKTDRYGHE